MQRLMPFIKSSLVLFVLSSCVQYELLDEFQPSERSALLEGVNEVKVLINVGFFDVYVTKPEDYDDGALVARGSDVGVTSTANLILGLADAIGDGVRANRAERARRMYAAIEQCLASEYLAGGGVPGLMSSTVYDKSADSTDNVVVERINYPARGVRKSTPHASLKLGQGLIQIHSRLSFTRNLDVVTATLGVSVDAKTQNGARHSEFTAIKVQGAIVAAAAEAVQETVLPCGIEPDSLEFLDDAQQDNLAYWLRADSAELISLYASAVQEFARLYPLLLKDNFGATTEVYEYDKRPFMYYTPYTSVTKPIKRIIRARARSVGQFDGRETVQIYHGDYISYPELGLPLTNIY